jgi:hypothetical protein
MYASVQPRQENISMISTASTTSLMRQQILIKVVLSSLLQYSKHPSKFVMCPLKHMSIVTLRSISTIPGLVAVAHVDGLLGKFAHK